MAKVTLSTIAAVASTSLLVSACAGGASLLRDGGHPITPPSREAPVLLPQELPGAGTVLLPGLPGSDAPAVAHLVSAAGEILIPPSDAAATTGGTVTKGQNGTDPLVLSPGGNDELDYAIYSVPGFDDARPMNFKVEAALHPGGNEELPLSYWVGVGDYTLNCWRWEGPFEDGASHEFSTHSGANKQRYVGENAAGDGNCRCAVAVVAMGSHEDDEVEFSTGAIETETVSDSVGAFQTKPHFTPILNADFGAKGASAAKSASGIAGEPSVTLQWHHYYDAGFTKSEAKDYEVFRTRARCAIDTDEPQEETLKKISDKSSYHIDPDTNRELSPGVRYAGPLPGAHYTYRLLTSNDAGDAPSQLFEVDVPLLPPAGFKASDDNDANIILTWTAQEHVLEYGIWRDQEPTSPPTTEPDDRVAGTETAWTDVVVQDRQPHSYWICARNDYAVRPGNPEGWGIVSDPDQGIIADMPAPENFSATGNGSGDAFEDHVHLQWDKVMVGTPAEEADFYEVYRDGYAPGQLLATINATGAATYTHDDQQDGTDDLSDANDHDYYVRAVLGGLKSGFASVPGSLLILAPTDLIASDGTNDGWVDLQWTAPQAVDHFEIYRDDQVTPIDTVPSGDTTYQDVGAFDADMHVYWVRAVDQYTSDFSGADAGYVNFAPTPDIQATPKNADYQIPVQLDASDSFDLDGGESGAGAGITLYEFDYGDGEGWFGNGGDPTAPAHTYSGRGRFTAKVRVTDNEGNPPVEASIEIGEWRGDWWCYGHDRQHSCRSAYTGSHTPPGYTNLSGANGPVSGVAIGLDGEAYFGASGLLVAFLPDGTHNWDFFTTGSQDVLTPALGADGSIYCTCKDGRLYAVTPDSGGYKWGPFDGGSANISAPSISADGYIYFACGTKVYRVDPDNGSQVWAYSIPGGGTSESCPAIAEDGTVYFGTKSTDSVIALWPGGTQRWLYQDTAAGHTDFKGAPCIDEDGNVYIANQNGKMVKLTSSLTLIDGCQGPQANVDCPALDGAGPTSGYVYLASLTADANDRGLWRMKKSPFGTLEKVYQTVGITGGDLLIDAGNAAFLGCGGQHVYCIDLAAKSQLWRSTGLAGDATASFALREGGDLFAGTNATGATPAFFRFNGP